MLTIRSGVMLEVGRAGAATGSTVDPAHRSELKEPVAISSQDGTLEIRLVAQQGSVSLDTVGKPVENFMVFGYEVLQGTASDGKIFGEGVYPAPTLKVNPGDRLIVHLENSLAGLTIRDHYDPALAKKGEEVALYPRQMTQAPTNLHTHGLRISPKGNSDNILLHVSAGLSNTYVYDIDEDHPQGAFWYHPHLHGLTAPQVYYGLAGILQVGRLEGDIPLVSKHALPVRNMVLQYNYVFDRKGGLAQINNPNWSQYVSTLSKPKGDELAKGTYKPLLTPVNFKQSRQGTTYAAVWWSGDLSVFNNRGRFQFIPENLKTFMASDAGSDVNRPANSQLPDYQRDVQFTVNGQFQPIVESNPGQTEIWVLSNVSDVAYMNVQLTETATGHHPKFAILGMDGNPSPAVHHPPAYDGRRLLIPPASRFVIAVTMPEEGDLVLEMPPIGEGATTYAEDAILYTNDGTDDPPAILGNLSVLPAHASYDDGFFLFPTQVLLRAKTSGEKRQSVVFEEGQRLDSSTVFTDISQVVPDFTRRLDVTGGFINELANKQDPKGFVYAFNNVGFPNAPLLQPRLDSVEEWTFRNYNNDEHPIHVHVNDFQVTDYFDPTTGLRAGPFKFLTDNYNLAKPLQINDPDQNVAMPAELSIRTRFQTYTGLFVMHCHRLNHEDNGLMLLVNVIPAVSTYGVATPGSATSPATVVVYDGEGDRPLASVVPFEDHAGELSLAMGDVDGDSVFDLVVGSGKGHAPEVAVYTGRAVDGAAPFETLLARFQPFSGAEGGGISVAVAPIDGSTSDNIIVGSGPGMPSEVRVYALGAAGESPSLYSSFAPYEDDTSGVTVTAGFVSFMSGRNSIVTAPGPGSVAKVRVFDYWLMKPTGLSVPGGNVPLDMCSSDNGQPSMIAEFEPFGSDYRGGVSMATGWLYGHLGGAERLVIGQLSGEGGVKIYSTGSALQDGPAIYLESPVDHGGLADFREDMHMAPFTGSGGVRVATTSTTTGADLLVSGADAGGDAIQLRKYDIDRPDAKSRFLVATELGKVTSSGGSTAIMVGGD